MDILITGGNGLLGCHLVEELQERGDSVRVLVLPEEDASRLAQRGVEVHRGDIRRPETLTPPMSGVDAVMHLAGMMGVWRPIGDYEAVNVTGTENVCWAALAQGARVIHVSSWTVYGMALGRPAREDFPLRPFPEPYAITKAAGDRVVQRMIAEQDLPAVIIRPGTFFGPGDRLHFARVADRLRDGKGVIVGSGDNALPFVYVTDVVRGLLLALDRERALGQAYNITNDRPLTQRQLLHAIAHEIGVSPPRCLGQLRLCTGRIRFSTRGRARGGADEPRATWDPAPALLRLRTEVHDRKATGNRRQRERLHDGAGDWRHRPDCQLSDRRDEHG